METTAGQIAGYTGNAAAALGSSAGGDTGVTSIWGDTDANRVNDLADRVYLYSFQKNKAIYDQKIADRDKLRSLMESEQVNPGVLLEKDRSYIESNFRNKIHDLLVQNPDISSDNAKYQELQGLMQKFKEAKAYGGVRLAAVTDLNKQIAAEVDPQKRAKMEAHRDQIMNEDIYKVPKPYQQTLDWDPNAIFVKVDPITSATEKIVGDSIVTVNTAHTPLARFTQMTRENYLNNENKTVADQMDLFARNFNEMPDTYKEQQVAQYNEKIAKANASENLKPGDLNYVPPIKGAWVDGKYVVQETVPDLVRAHAIMKNFVDSEAEAAKVSKLPSDIEQSRAQTKKILKEADVLIPAQAALAYAQAKKARADAEKTVQEAKDARDAAALKQEQGNFYLQETMQTFDPRNYNGLPQLKGDGNISWKDMNGEHSAYMGGNFKGVKGIVLQYSDGAKTVTSLSPFQLQAMGRRFKAANGTTVINPTTVVYDPGNGKNPRILARYEYDAPAGGSVKADQLAKLDKQIEAATDTREKARLQAQRVTIAQMDDEQKTERKVEMLEIKPIDFARGVIKNTIGEESAGKENEEYGRLIQEVKRRTGGSENINGWVIPLAEQKQNAKGSSIYEESKNLFK